MYAYILLREAMPNQAVVTDLTRAFEPVAPGAPILPRRRESTGASEACQSTPQQTDDGCLLLQTRAIEHLTPKDRRVLDTLIQVPHGLTPTDVGRMHGKPYERASGWASPSLRALCQRGLAVRQRVRDRRVRVLYLAHPELSAHRSVAVWPWHLEYSRDGKDWTYHVSGSSVRSIKRAARQLMRTESVSTVYRILDKRDRLAFAGRRRGSRLSWQASGLIDAHGVDRLGRAMAGCR